MKTQARLWRVTDVDNHFETVLLIILTLLCLFRSTASERLYGRSSFSSRLQRAELPLCIAATVLTLCVVVARVIYARREKSQLSIRYEAYRGDVVIDIGAGNEQSMKTTTCDGVSLYRTYSNGHYY